MIEIIIAVIICVVLQILAKKTQDPGKLKIYIIVNSICLGIHVFLFLSGSVRTIAMVLYSPTFLLFLLLDLVRVACFVLWHIILIIGASKRRKELLAEEDNVQVVYCSKCGTAAVKGTVFCTECGEKIEQEESAL